MPHSTTGSARSFGAFRFPYDKYEDEIALYENFRYLQEYLRFLGTGDKHGPDYIIGAEDSHNITQAHYKCNGTDDNTVIQQAFDDSETDGSQLWVHMLGGTYNIGATLSVPANIRLTGAGMGKTVLRATETDITMLNIIHEGGGICTISDLTINGEDLSGTRGVGWFQGASSPAQITILDRVQITQMGHNAAETSLFAGPNYMWFNNCIVTDNASSTATLRMRSLSAVILTNSLFAGNAGHVLSPAGSSEQVHLTSGNLVIGNGGLFIVNHTNPVDNHNYKVSNVGDTDTDGAHSFESEEAIEDVVGGMVTGNTETGITVTYEDSDGTLDFVVDTEFIADTVGAMVTGNTETLIAVTYDDADNTLDFVVEDDLSLYDNTTSAFIDTATHDAHDHTTAMGTVVLGDISDVGVGTPTAGNLLEGDGDSWESVAPSTIDAADFGSDTATDGFVLTADGAGGAAWEAAPGAGGGIDNVVEDLTPQLGGDLDVNGQSIVSVSNGNITINPDGTGNVLLGNYTLDGDQTVGAGQDNYVLTYDNGSGLIALEAAAAGGISNVVDDTTPQLGGALDVNGQIITSASSGNVTIDPDGTGDIVLTAADLDVNMANGITIDAIDNIVIASSTGTIDLTGSTVDVTGDLTVSGEAYVGAGVAGTPSISFGGDPNTGFFNTSADNIGVTLGANHRYQFTDTYFGGTVAGSIQIKAAASSIAAPGVTFSGDSDTGIHSVGSGQVQLIGNGATNAAFTTTATSFQTGTTGSAANLRQASSGAAVERSTSALKYKTELEDADWLADIELKPQKFYREDDDRYYYGFIADWLGEQDEILGEYIDGEIENYDQRAILAVLAAKVNRLEEENSTLKAIVEELWQG